MPDDLKDDPNAPEATLPAPAPAPALHKSGLAYILDAAGKPTNAVADPVNGEAIPLDNAGDLSRWPLTPAIT